MKFRSLQWIFGIFMSLPASTVQSCGIQGQSAKVRLKCRSLWQFREIYRAVLSAAVRPNVVYQKATHRRALLSELLRAIDVISGC